jgi:hypothetical protein
MKREIVVKDQILYSVSIAEWNEKKEFIQDKKIKFPYWRYLSRIFFTEETHLRLQKESLFETESSMIYDSYGDTFNQEGDSVTFM